MHSERKIIAACGNDCAACPRYTDHPYEKSDAQLRRTAELWKTIGYRDRVVTNEEIACPGCRAENWCRYNIVRCCRKQGFETCASCPAYPCDVLAECFEKTQSFEAMCRNACTDEEYKQMKTAFFEKKENLGAQAHRLRDQRSPLKGNKR